MKRFLLLALLVLVAVNVSAQPYYECDISVDQSKIDDPASPCGSYRGEGHTRCQLYDGYSGSGVPTFCKTTCLDRVNIPTECAKIIVQLSNNPEAHENQVSLPDLDFIEEVIEVVFGGKDRAAERTLECEEWEKVVDGECVDTCEFDEKLVDDKCVPDVPVAPNGFEVIKIDGNPDVIHLVDAFGHDRYTQDGKHFYSDYGVAASPGIFRNGWNGFAGGLGGAFDFVFATKFKDPDLRLQDKVARETVRDMRTFNEKAKNYGLLVAGLAASNYVAMAGAPASTIALLANEASESEFSQGVRLYIEERKTYGVTALFDNPPPELQGEGGLGPGAVAASLYSKYGKTVLFNKYEESYQRYLLAKQLGRTE